MLSAKLIDSNFIDVLTRLLKEEWHCEHESIIDSLDDLRCYSCVDIFFDTALAHYEYLDYDEAFALAVKCIWGLGNIGTKEAREKLQLLAKSDNDIIKENALYQLANGASRALF